MGKRIFDLALALPALILLSPLFILIAGLIKIGSPGPVFFLQQRIGKGFRPFYIYRFRTFASEAPAARNGGAEGRPSRIGRTLHALKLEHLPQLINVVKGEMSLVGPRPETEIYVERFRKDFETILDVPPGITDLASVELRFAPTPPPQERSREFYFATVLPRKVKLAKVYVQNRGFLLDLRILLTTLTTLFLSWPAPFPKGEEGEKRIKDLILDFRIWIILSAHAAAVAASSYIAFWLRFDGNIPPETFDLLVKTLPIVLSVRMGALHYFGLNRGLWRYASIQDLISIVWAILVSSVGIWTAVAVSPWTGYPRSVYLIDASLLLLILASLRMIKRVYAILTRTTAGARRVLIIGAGNAGEMVSRDMRRNPSYNRQPVAFIDDDPKKRRLKIHNIPVIGNCDEIEKAIRQVHPDEILIAIPSATPAQIKSIIGRCKTFGLPIKTLPNLSGLLGGTVSVADIRSLDIEDLIRRPEIQIDDPAAAAGVRGKRVLITGAGGSIGSELCRQAASFRPERLILFERSENNLHRIQLDLAERFPDAPLEIVLGDILDREKLDRVFAAHRPQIIFHAAAYKHVPMMERHPLEAVQNNILGTYEVMTAARRCDAESFVLISTDKAVYPTSVMGATKRAAETLVRHLSRGSRTKVVSVRFGNVLESSGSVVPLFREQIKKRGPVTVTHPDATRYFITIQEAVQLVLQAAVLGEGGEVFVLDMGDPIKILDLAKTMIILSGFSPDEEIPIELIGLRPGEKMTEMLFEKEEKVIRTRHEKIWRAENGGGAQDPLPFIERFAAMDLQTDPSEIRAKLKELVPTYGGDESVVSSSIICGGQSGICGGQSG